MTPRPFVYSDASVQTKTVYQVWCAACLKWIGSPQATEHEPYLKEIANVHRERHARGRV